jgi:hypothetical protein
MDMIVNISVDVRLIIKKEYLQIGSSHLDFHDFVISIGKKQTIT